MNTIKYFTNVYNKIERRIRTLSHIEYNNKNMTALSLWDTGASCSCVSEEVIKQLGLVAVSKVSILTPSSKIPEIRDLYIVTIELPNKVLIPNVSVCSSEIGKQGIHLLIGMDIISKGDFAISNFNNKTIFSFRFPSCEDINFVNEARKTDLLKNTTHGKGKRKRK